MESVVPLVQKNTLVNNPALYAVEKIAHKAQILLNDNPSSKKKSYGINILKCFWRCVDDKAENELIPLISAEAVSAEEREAIFLLKRSLSALSISEKKANAQHQQGLFFQEMKPLGKQKSVLAHERAKEAIALIQNTLASKKITAYHQCLNEIISSLGEQHQCITTYEAHSGHSIN